MLYPLKLSESAQLCLFGFFIHLAQHVRIHHFLFPSTTNRQPGANPNPDDCPNNWTPLHAAVDSNRSDVVRLLLEAGADTNAARIEDGWTPLHFAARKSNVKIVPGQAGRGSRPFSMRIVM